MITKILLVIAVLLLAFVVVAALQPDTFHVERSTTISTPPTIPFAQINDLHRWQEMSPYAKLDPAATYAFEGPPAGVGASMRWNGNSKVGEGKMAIVESRPNELVKMQLDFQKPFTSSCTGEFQFKPAGTGTNVTWSMSGPKNFVSKAMCLVISMDKMVGGQFEEGLANLKRISEAKAP